MLEHWSAASLRNLEGPPAGSVRFDPSFGLVLAGHGCHLLAGGGITPAFAFP